MIKNLRIRNKKDCDETVGLEEFMITLKQERKKKKADIDILEIVTDISYLISSINSFKSKVRRKYDILLVILVPIKGEFPINDPKNSISVLDRSVDGDKKFFTALISSSTDAVPKLDRFRKAFS